MEENLELKREALLTGVLADCVTLAGIIYSIVRFDFPCMRFFSISKECGRLFRCEEFNIISSLWNGGNFNLAAGISLDNFLSLHKSVYSIANYVASRLYPFWRYFLLIF